jgi:hypothetical protein
MLAVVAVSLLVQACSCSSTSIRGHADLDGFADVVPDGPASHWILQAGGPDDEMALSAVPLTDGTFAVAGLRGSFDTDMDLWIVRYDGSGNVLGQWVIPEVTGDVAPVVEPLEDGGMVVSGVIGEDLWLVRYDAGGGAAWQKVLAVPGVEDNQDVLQTADGGLLISARRVEGGQADLLLVKLGADAELEWSITVGGAGEEQSAGRETLVQAADGTVFVLGQSNSWSSMEMDAWILALDADGALLWQQVVGVSGTESSTGMAIALSGGDIYLAGQTDLSPHPTCAAWVVRMTTSGDLVWQKAYAAGGCDSALGIVPEGGGVVIAGNVSTESGASYDMWVAAVDTDGNLAWQRNIGQDGELELGISLGRHAGDLLVLGRYIAAGGLGHQDFLLVRMGADGSFAGTCELVGDGTSTAEDSTATVLATDAVAADVDVVVGDGEAEVESAEVAHAFLCGD